MTTDELRDWHARKDGWFHVQHGSWAKDEDTARSIRAGVLPGLDHPFPPTRDGAASAMPEGVIAEHRYCETMHRWEWNARTPDGSFAMMERGPIRVPDTGDEIHDRYLLAKLVKEMMNANPC